MKKTFLVIMVLAVALMFAAPSFAGNKNDLAYKNLDELDSVSSVTSTDGIIVSQSSVPKQGLTVADIVGTDQDGGGTSLSSGFLVDVERHNTTDTTLILASETGKTYICSKNTKFQLPAASAGLSYTFVTEATSEVDIQVSTTPDTIVLVSAGDGNGSQGVIETGINTTGNTVTLISDGTSWYASCKYTLDAGWVDGGVWQQLDRGAQE